MPLLKQAVMGSPLETPCIATCTLFSVLKFPSRKSIMVSIRGAQHKAKAERLVNQQGWGGEGLVLFGKAKLTHVPIPGG